MKKNLLSHLWVFTASLFVTILAVYLYSPVLGSNADSANLNVKTSVNPVISLSLDTNALNYAITPNAEGVFLSKPLVSTVDTNSIAGYELYFSAIGNNTALTSTTTSATVDSDFNDTVTSPTMANNKWGYSLDNTNFIRIPALADQALLKNLDHYPSESERSTTVNIGIKISSNLPSGAYKNQVIFSAIAHQNPKTIKDITSMQDIDSTTCNLTGTHETAVLTDERDGNTYHITKLLDGNCWMTDNLRITGKTITSADSDLPDGVSYTIPTSSIYGFWNRDIENAYVDSTYGGFYNFYVATAGWGMDSTAGEEVDSPQSICPKGWRLPTAGYKPGEEGEDVIMGEYQVMYSYYPSLEQIQGIPNFKIDSGEIVNGTHMSTYAGFYWSGTNYNSYNGRYFYLPSTGIARISDTASSDNKPMGFNVRCIAK